MQLVGWWLVSWLVGWAVRDYGSLTDAGGLGERSKGSWVEWGWTGLSCWGGPTGRGRLEVASARPTLLEERGTRAGCPLRLDETEGGERES